MQTNFPISSGIPVTVSQVTQGTPAASASASPSPSPIASALSGAESRASDALQQHSATTGLAGTDGATARTSAFTSTGTLSPDTLIWLDAAGIKPARATAGPCAYVSCGIFVYLNTGRKELARPFFEKMLDFGTLGKNANMSAGSALEQLQASGLKIRADLFLDNGKKGFAANERSLSMFPDRVTTHPFDLEKLRAAIQEIGIGEAAMFFIDNYHVISIARGTDGWHAFDTGLNPRANVYEGAHRLWSSASFADRVTKDGANHVHGAGAEALIEDYVQRVSAQPVLFRMAR